MHFFGSSGPMVIPPNVARLGRASILAAADFACWLQGLAPGRGNHNTTQIAYALVAAFDLFRDGQACMADGLPASELWQAFLRANYGEKQAKAVFQRKSGPGRKPYLHLIAFMASLRAVMEQANPRWRKIGWTINVKKEDEWLSDEMADDIDPQAAAEFRLKTSSGADRVLSEFESIAKQWLAMCGETDVHWSQQTTERTKSLYYSNRQNLFFRQKHRGNFRRKHH